MLQRLLLACVCLTPVAAWADLCAVASAKETYDGFDGLSKPLKEEISNYKKRWRSYCGKREASEVLALFEGLIVLAPKLQAEVESKHQEDFLEPLRNKLPTFVPAVQCFVYDGSTQCQASFEQFADVAAKGTVEDKLFAETYRAVRGYDTMPPWIHQTWDYGGCTRYGEFDWVGTLKKIDEARGNVQGKTYGDQLNELKHGLFDRIAGDVTREGTCSCKSKTAPLKDLPKVVAYLEKTKESAEYLGQARTLLSGLQKKKFKLRSDAEAHCSGG